MKKSVAWREVAAKLQRDQTKVSVSPTQGRRENFRAPGQKIRLGPLVSGAPKTHD